MLLSLSCQGQSPLISTLWSTAETVSLCPLSSPSLLQTHPSFKPIPPSSPFLIYITIPVSIFNNFFTTGSFSDWFRPDLLYHFLLSSPLFFFSVLSSPIAFYTIALWLSIFSTRLYDSCFDSTTRSHTVHFIFIYIYVKILFQHTDTPTHMNLTPPPPLPPPSHTRTHTDKLLLNTHTYVYTHTFSCRVTQGLRRRGYTPEIVNSFCRDIGATRNANTVQYERLAAMYVTPHNVTRLPSEDLSLLHFIPCSHSFSFQCPYFIFFFHFHFHFIRARAQLHETSPRVSMYVPSKEWIPIWTWTWMCTVVSWSNNYVWSVSNTILTGSITSCHIISYQIVSHRILCSARSLTPSPPPCPIT